MNADHIVPSDEMGPALTRQKPKAKPAPAKDAKDAVPSSGEIGPARRPAAPPQPSPPPGDDRSADTRAKSDPEPLAPTPMPKRVGGFTVIDALGMGGMGHVYLARQDSLERLVAVKVLRNELAKDKGYLERFQREAKAAAMFQHPHVVAVIDTGHDAPSNLYYIAFEYVDGGSLESLVRANGALPERRSLEITKAVALALQFAESRRLVHRDLKPANILIGADGTPKLADLGLVRNAERVGPQVTQDGIILGTPLYMAPEQALGRDIDVRADIYALGLCLFRMLTGRTPFNETEDTCSTLAILSRHVNEELPSVREFVKNVQESTVRLIADMTARDVEKRYRSAAHVAQDIDRVLIGQQPLGARGYLPAADSDAPTTALTGIRPEDLQKKESARVGRVAADSAPTVAAAVVAPPAAAEETKAASPTSKSPAAPKAPLPPPPPRASGGNGGLLVALAATLLGLVAVASQLPFTKQGDDVSGVTPLTTNTQTPPIDPRVFATETPVDPVPTATTASEVPPIDPTTDVAPDPEPDPVVPPDELPSDPIGELPPLDPPPPASTETATVTEPAPPVTTTEELAPPPAPDAVRDAIHEARGDPDKIAVLVRQISLELFVDVPHGREHFEELIARSGWAASPLRERFVEVMRAILAAFDPVDSWDERQRRLERVVYLTRERMRASDIERLKYAIDAEFVRWGVFAAGAGRVRLALGDPRTEEQALRSFEALPDDCFVREDARALLAMGRAADQPDRWVRMPERRAEVALAVRELRERVARTALALVVAEEATVVARVLERQLDDAHASLPSAVLRTWEEGAITVAGQARAIDQSVFLQARRREVPNGAPWTSLQGWALAVGLGAPVTGNAGVTVSIDDRLTVHLGAAGVVVGGSFTRWDLTTARTILIEPRFDGMLLRAPGARPEETMVRLPERPVEPVRFSVRAQGAEVTSLVLVRLPVRPGNDPRALRESVRRQRQGR